MRTTIRPADSAGLDPYAAAVTVCEERDPAAATLAVTAEIVRAAFAAGDRFPGLPPADGTGETAQAVAADLTGGARLWTAWAGDRQLGSVRAVREPAGPAGGPGWRVRRLAVRPEARGYGVARLLLRTLEAAALADGADQVRLDAVVERGNPPFYCGLGYRTVGHFANPDKPLSEVAMCRRLDGPARRLAYPFGGEPEPPARGALLAWFAVRGGTVVVPGRLGPDLATRLTRLAARRLAALNSAAAAERAVAGGSAGVRWLGADGWLGASEVDATRLWERLAGRADAVRCGVALFRRPPGAVGAFTMPRAAHPGLLALWRLPPVAARQAGPGDRPRG